MAEEHAKACTCAITRDQAKSQQEQSKRQRFELQLLLQLFFEIRLEEQISFSNTAERRTRQKLYTVCLSHTTAKGHQEGGLPISLTARS